MPLLLHEAKRHAAALCDWLRPYTDTNTGSVILVAGSIRRERPQVNDIDIVCIPKVIEEKDLTGTVIARSWPIIDFLCSYIRSKNPSAVRTSEFPHFISGWDLDRRQPSTLNPSQLLIWLPKIKCQLDLWLADEANLATRLICRTGSKEHNIYLAERAASLGGHWNPYDGLTISKVKIPTPNEESLYSALQLKFIEPKLREREFIHKYLEYGL